MALAHPTHPTESRRLRAADNRLTAMEPCVLSQPSSLPPAQCLLVPLPPADSSALLSSLEPQVLRQLLPSPAPHPSAPSPLVGSTSLLTTLGTLALGQPSPLLLPLCLLALLLPEGSTSPLRRRSSLAASLFCSQAAPLTLAEQHLSPSQVVLPILAGPHQFRLFQ